jgi:hypothetical protein
MIRTRDDLVGNTDFDKLFQVIAQRSSMDPAELAKIKDSLTSEQRRMLLR